MTTEPSGFVEVELRADLLTAQEHRAMDVTAQLWDLLGEIVGIGPARSGDLRELAQHIHAIQHTVLSQAAARAYRDRYRLLGDPDWQGSEGGLYT